MKLRDCVESFSVRARDYSLKMENMEFFGVSNTEGITRSRYAAEDKAEEYKIIEKGCFAYNPYRVNVGSVAYLSEDVAGLISPAYVVFKLKPETVLPELLLKFLKSGEGLRQIKLNARGTVRQALRFEDLCNIEVEFPPFEKQTEFYNKFSFFEDDSNTLSTELSHQLSLLKNLRQAFLREAMQGHLTQAWREAQSTGSETGAQLLQKIKAEKATGKGKKAAALPAITESEIPFEIPENWVWCRLEDIISILGDGLHGTPYFDIHGEYYFVNGNNLTDGRITFKQETKRVSEKEYLKHRKTLNDRSILVSINGTLGNVAFYKDEKIILGKSACYFNLIEGISKFYIKNFIDSPYFLDYALFVAKETTIKNVSLKAMRLMPIPLPPLAEQEAIVAKLDALMAGCDALEAQIKESEALNRQLLQQVLREALA